MAKPSALTISLGVLFAAITVAGTIAAATRDPNNTTGSRGLIMIDKRGGLVRFFDPATLKETATLDIGGAPHELAVSPDHTVAYIPIYGDGVYGRNPHPGHVIAIVDLATHVVTGTIDVSPNEAPHGLQVDAGGMLYAVCDLSRKLLVIDPKTRSIRATIDTEGTSHWLAVLPDGSKAYTANKNDRPFVSVIDLRTRTMVGKVPMPNGTQGITSSPDGRWVIAADFSRPSIHVIDTATDRVVDTVAVDRNPAGGPFRLKYSPDGTTLMTTSTGGTMVNVFDAAKLHEAQRVVSVGKDPFGVAFTADSKTALVSNHGDGTISVVDVASGTVRSSFTAGTGIETLAFY